MKQLTWAECAAQLKKGDRVVFAAEWDAYPHTFVPQGTTARVTNNELDGRYCSLALLPDDDKIRGDLADWEGEIILGWDIADPQAPESDGGWRSLVSPLAKDAELERLAKEARPLSDDEWGSERQIDAENAFGAALNKRLSRDEMLYLETYAERATTDEWVDEAESLLQGTSSGYVRWLEGR